MKWIKKYNESSISDSEIIDEIESIFIEVLENQNFEIDSYRQESDIFDVIYKIDINLGAKTSLKVPIKSNLYIGFVETELEFLKNKHQKYLELLEDIEVAELRIKDIFKGCRVRVWANRREEVEIQILVQKNNI